MENKINEQIVNKLNQLGLTISTCESMTGGAIGANLVLVNNASKCFLGSLTTYSKNSKVRLAKINPETEVISQQCAKEMAQGCQRMFNSDIAISVTGKATDVKPFAYVCINLFDNVYEYKFESRYDDRVNSINQCVAFCYNKLWDLIKDLRK